MSIETVGSSANLIKNNNAESWVKKNDLEVNKILTEKISELTPNIPIISEETVNSFRNAVRITSSGNYWAARRTFVNIL